MILIKEWYNDAKTNGSQTIHCYRKVFEWKENASI